jgi:Tfp pilus assembly protein PilZ
MTEDRRNDERVVTNLQATWDGLSGTHEARVEDLSMGGCFINTTRRVDIGEIVVLEMKLPSGEWLQLRGEVTAYQPGIGFGLLFSFLTDEEEYALRQLIT